MGVAFILMMMNFGKRHTIKKVLLKIVILDINLCKYTFVHF